MATSLSPSHHKTITHTTSDNNVAIFDMELLPKTGSTFVQVDPSNFRALVQKLTGPSSSRDSSDHKLPVTYRTPESVGRPIQPFKLQERRRSRKKLETNLQNVPGVEHPYSSSPNYITSSSPLQNRVLIDNIDGFRGFDDGSRVELGMANASPVSTLNFMGAHGVIMTSLRTQMSMEELEEKCIAEKGFYLHPTPPRCRGSDPPELLPLFPIHHSP